MSKGHVSDGVTQAFNTLPSSTGTQQRSREAPRLAKGCTKGNSFVPEGGNMCVPIPALHAHPRER